MQVDHIIVGQGISGSFLSWYLIKEGKSVLVIDEENATTASRVAAGIINPVTGRRMVTVWMAEELFPFAWKAYNEFGAELGITAISQKTIIDFFPSPFMRESFLTRIEQRDLYTHTYPEQNDFNPFFNYEFGCGEIRPSYLAHLDLLLPAWRKKLKEQNLILESKFENQKLKVSANSVFYEGIEANSIIFCDGVAGASNPYFEALPFAPNKGEVLLVEIEGLPDKHIYKKSLMLAPMKTPGLFWAGSVYHWEFEHTNPTPEFKASTVKQLQSWIKLPFKVVEHLAAVRPATLERRPFVGMHPVYQRVGIFNGMGAKGCSLAPYFANQLKDHLVYHTDISPEADVKRFSRLLSKA